MLLLWRHLPNPVANGKVVRRQTAKRNSEVLEPSTPLRDLEAGAGIDYPAPSQPLQTQLPLGVAAIDQTLHPLSARH